MIKTWLNVHLMRNSIVDKAVWSKNVVRPIVDSFYRQLETCSLHTTAKFLIAITHLLILQTTKFPPQIRWHFCSVNSYINSTSTRFNSILVIFMHKTRKESERLISCNYFTIADEKGKKRDEIVLLNWCSMFAGNKTPTRPIINPY